MSIDEERAAKRQARLDNMTSDEICIEYRRYMDDLDNLTGGSGDEAYLKANSARFAWTELQRRGQEALVQASDGHRRNHLEQQTFTRR